MKCYVYNTQHIAVKQETSWELRVSGATVLTDSNPIPALGYRPLDLQGGGRALKAVTYLPPGSAQPRPEARGAGWVWGQR